ncbi:type I-F CRISPR-associated protein Csy3 [Zymomonas mobilis]|uniref:type I-F CRISPR-associated protein Csy3 n=1 Tax=Zymomonas mobilis TaxID=542 RepID=UPI0003C760DD|nr:type I-F CRISPR-associated protein Csy3 [Zymomonas mobilis]AHB09919.1 CRISPR-associated protein, Csy3 family [Zymomonas mobilis subsp. mobilis str. CP4 = NRRL B-14023]AHJ70224.1 CRISPR type I-F/YPEST-associated protein Csy3 [Zymomonas mobilis subsp. mobilis NRRL B-12526]AHJ72079.1 CRISPR type I-F/YPEST-associated protein Csy3 [Zymomonas mobilis subsp. mobilis str. CP4 = NRRL B-14023]TWE24427.1 CRISPR-associated Csy3 family protein [Zymomonas mobilis]
MSEEKNLKTASVLSFERKLDPSDALFFSGNWSNKSDDKAWQPIHLREKSVRGTISNRLKKGEADPAKLNAAIEKPNLQTVDVATLPFDSDTLKVEFTLRVLGGVGEPAACNSMEYRSKLVATISHYIDTHGLDILGNRYAANLANGRFLWRNRLGADAISIQITRLSGDESTLVGVFDALAHPLRQFEEKSVSEELEALAKLITAGLAGQEHVLLRVKAFIRMGEGQEVFPSQELLLDKGKSTKSRFLYSVGQDEKAIAAIHSQKIGNALRTIDTWYPDAEINGPIAVEPYGSVTTQGVAYRQPKAKKDFYSLLDAWVLKDKEPAIEDQHFVIAVLVRGGVFGDAS